MELQWYPGHMTKAKRQMQEDIKFIDLMIELVDARIPRSSRNPEMDVLAAGKKRIIILNRDDLADPVRTGRWMEEFRGRGYLAVCLDARSKVGMKQVTAAILEASREKVERDRLRGIKNRPVRAMVAGIPNVGKSTFINSLAGKACTKTGNRPGVTKGKQWIRLNQNVELLDTPGILWPKFENQNIGLHLALTGAIRDEILPVEELAVKLITFCMAHYPDILSVRYGLEAIDLQEDVYPVLEQIAWKRKCIKKGETPDTQKAAAILIDDFRSGRLGRISLESPDEDS